MFRLRLRHTLVLLVTLAAGCTFEDCTGPTYPTERVSQPERRGHHYFPVLTEIPDARGRTIDPEFFGLHLIRIGTHWTWPQTGFGLYRLINATPRWHDLELERDVMLEDGNGLGRLDYALYFRDNYGGGSAATMYTLAGGPNGGFPLWMDTVKTHADSIAEWREYVRFMGQGYSGRIKYWEIWNEINTSVFYDGTGALMAELTKVAAEELRAIDPSNVIISPNVASLSYEENYLGIMDDFLEAGGGRYVDILAFHPAPPPLPESDTAHIRQVHSLFAEHGLSHLPVWATEGQAWANPGSPPEALVARIHLVMLAYGISNWSYYCWDIWEHEPIGGAEYVPLSENLRPDVLTPAGVAYREIVTWLAGARLKDVLIDGQNWTIEIERDGGYHGWIVWKTGEGPQPATPAFNVPAGATRFRRLDGSSVDAAPGSVYQPTLTPVLFERAN